ncbi:MAG: Phosphoribosylformylglycinamidine synthase, glutamine amidotransferase subunit, partial [uncultured Sphingomonadaceae bacterium]
EERRGRLSRLQLRPRPGGRATGSNRAGTRHALASRDRTAGRPRPDRRPRRLLLRRLPPLGRDGRALARHARSEGRGGQGRRRARRVQRLPDPDRSRAAPGRLDAQLRDTLCLPRRPAPRGQRGHAVHPPLRAGRGDRSARRPPRRQLPGGRGHARPAGGRRPRRLPLRRPLQRLRPRHRRHRQRTQQRARPDAPPRARLRPRTRWARGAALVRGSGGGARL